MQSLALVTSANKDACTELESHGTEFGDATIKAS